MRDQMRLEFLKYDIEPMIQKYGLKQDENYVYIIFIGRNYRIDKKTGQVDLIPNSGEKAIQANYSESMTIYDVLCYAKKYAFLSNKFISTNQLGGNMRAFSPGTNMFSRFAASFDNQNEKLKKACEQLGGTMYPVGEIAYQIPLFDFLPAVFQFWNSDDEFNAEIKIMWDSNILDYMHFETVFFAAGCLLRRIQKFIEEDEKEVLSPGASPLSWH